MTGPAVISVPGGGGGGGDDNLISFVVLKHILFVTVTCSHSCALSC